MKTSMPVNEIFTGTHSESGIVILALLRLVEAEDSIISHKLYFGILLTFWSNIKALTQKIKST